MAEAGKEPHQTMFWRLLFKSSIEVTDEEVAYFSQYPDRVDEVSAPINVYKWFLWAIAAAGASLLAFSKWLKHSGVLADLADSVSEFVVDLAYESGAAMIGAAITACMLGLLLNNQLENAAKWRKAIRRRIARQASRSGQHASAPGEVR